MSICENDSYASWLRGNLRMLTGVVLLVVPVNVQAQDTTVVPIQQTPATQTILSILRRRRSWVCGKSERLRPSIVSMGARC